MNAQTIALFGEAEKGIYNTGYFCENLSQLVEHFGNPPPHTRGLYFAIQALLFHYNLIFFRVMEEGFSPRDYLQGLQLLEKEQSSRRVQALCVPGVGDSEIIQVLIPFCVIHHTIMIMNERDLYDYLTC